jgi:hypothetical protein
MWESLHFHAFDMYLYKESVIVAVLENRWFMSWIWWISDFLSVERKSGYLCPSVGGFFTVHASFTTAFWKFSYSKSPVVELKRPPCLLEIITTSTDISKSPLVPRYSVVELKRPPCFLEIISMSTDTTIEAHRAGLL